MNETAKRVLLVILAWLQGAVAAVIGGAANSITPALVAPETFNLKTGLNNLLLVAAGGALISLAFYLKKSPLPGVKGGDV